MCACVCACMPGIGLPAYLAFHSATINKEGPPITYVSCTTAGADTSRQSQATFHRAKEEQPVKESPGWLDGPRSRWLGPFWPLGRSCSAGQTGCK